jgi:hypothetical protein
MKKRYILLAIISLSLAEGTAGNTLNGHPPQEQSAVLQRALIPGALGVNVFIFDPTMPTGEIQGILDSIFDKQYRAEFSSDRYALLFKPGTYTLDIRVGYYMQIAGLGPSPEDVVIRGAVRSNSKREGGGHVLTNFWRSVENLTIIPVADSTNVWGVSQAAPMRRVHIMGNLQLHDNGYASGGFLADSRIDGTVKAGGQQQWLSRNCQWGSWEGGAWNILSMGVVDPPPDNWPAGPYTTIEETPVSREKPFLVLLDEHLYLRVPGPRINSVGPSWPALSEDQRTLPLDDFYIANPEKDDASTINHALEKGENILFTPGIYHLEHPLDIIHPGTVVMGLGMPSLVPLGGEAVIRTADVGGIILSGLLMDAGKIPSEALLQVGNPGSRVDHGSDPSWLFDLFFRVGGPFEGSVTSCIEVNSNHLFIDHLWLWRADHGNGVGWDLNRSDHGMVVNGDHVTVYGLFNEHHQKYQTLWNGEGGRVYLYQSEMPYDPPSIESWKHGQTGGYASYKVGENVASHEAWCVGVYCVFYEAPILVDQAIETPARLEQSIHRKFTFWLNGYENSMIRSIINGKGEAVHSSNRKADLF